MASLENGSSDFVNTGSAEDIEGILRGFLDSLWTDSTGNSPTTSLLI